MNLDAKILIIDDEEVVLDSCMQILEGSDYVVKTAMDGNHGLAIMRSFLPDIIFVDLKMPGLSGFEVLDKIHTFDDTIVSVVITGFATVSSAVDAMKKGAYDFLPKPFTPDEFRLITRRGIERRKLMLEAIKLRKEKELLREQFASIVSHELKAPLSAVQQNIFAMEFELEKVLNQEQKNTIERIKTRIEELLIMINSWMRVISVDPAKLKEGFTPLLINLPITNAIESLAQYATRKNITFETDLDKNIEKIMGDQVSLTEVFVNIIGNAVKYSPDNSKIKINSTQNGKQMDITISDAGIGIAKEDIPHIFDGFYRGKSAEKTEGHGIGLAVSHQIVEAHDGSISVSSEMGKGTTFLLHFPITEN